jgi:hypothetical protein
MRLRACGILVSAVAALAPVSAHHSGATLYVFDREIVNTGVVTEFRFINPHMRLYMDVTSAAGQVEKWMAEGGTPIVLTRRGWTSDVLKPGDRGTGARKPGQGRGQDHALALGHAARRQRAVCGGRGLRRRRQAPPAPLRVGEGARLRESTVTRLTSACDAVLGLYALTTSPTAQTVYPTGTTIYDPDRSWSGFTVLSPLGTAAVLVIDMNGNVVKRWDDFNNSAGGPARVLPGGIVMAARGARPPHQESLELIRRDFDRKDLWQVSRSEQITTREGGMVWSARQHHDWQLESFPAGYYSPEYTRDANGGNTLILAHTDRMQPKVADVMLGDDRLIEVSPKGEIVWDWVASDHIDEFGFAPDARSAIKAARSFNKARGSFDWLHVNSATYVGPNQWFDNGDRRFAPNNVIISSREASLLAIVGRDGRIVWQLGPDFSASRELRAIRQTAYAAFQVYDFSASARVIRGSG